MWPPKKRQRVTRACDLCKGRKKQCSGTQPCTTCLSKSASCTFSTPNQLQNRHQHHQRLSPYPYPRSSLPPHELSDEDVGDSLETPLYHKSAPSHKWSAGSGLDHAHSHAPALKEPDIQDETSVQNRGRLLQDSGGRLGEHRHGYFQRATLYFVHFSCMICKYRRHCTIHH